MVGVRGRGDALITSVFGPVGAGCIPGRLSILLCSVCIGKALAYPMPEVQDVSLLVYLSAADLPAVFVNETCEHQKAPVLILRRGMCLA